MGKQPKPSESHSAFSLKISLEMWAVLLVGRAVHWVHSKPSPSTESRASSHMIKIVAVGGDSVGKKAQ